MDQSISLATHDPFRTWEGRAGVRHCAFPPRAFKADGLWAPASLHPCSRHPLVRSRDASGPLLGLEQLALMRFTARLEDYGVFPVARDLAHEASGFDLPAYMVDGAGAVAIDESSHSQKARLIAGSIVKDLHGIAATPRDEKFLLFVSACDGCSVRDRPLRQLAAVCASETLITGGLLMTARDPTVDSTVRAYYDEHHSDEARHHVLFGALLGVLWSQMTLAEKIFFGADLMPTAIRLYLEPDPLARMQDLISVGFTADQAEEIAVAALAVSETRSSIIRSAAPTVRFMARAGMLEHPCVTKALVAAGLTEP